MPDRAGSKRQALQASGTFHSRPGRVRHPLFQQSDFFDPQDLLQLKYESLRSLQKEQYSLARACRSVGFFRSARPAPAQIREFALAAKRAVFAGPGGQRVWSVASNALSGAGALCRSRSGRIAAGQARSAPGAQSDPASAEICAEAFAGRAGPQRAATGRAGAQTLQAQGASPHAGESLESQGKKGASEMTRRGLGSSAVNWAERYESLRGYVLEGRQRLQSQPLGLALWAAKGM